MDELIAVPPKPIDHGDPWKIDMDTFYHFMNRLVDKDKSDHQINRRGPPQLQDQVEGESWLAEKEKKMVG